MKIITDILKILLWVIVIVVIGFITINLIFFLSYSLSNGFSKKNTKLFIKNLLDEKSESGKVLGFIISLIIVSVIIFIVTAIYIMSTR